MARLAESSTLRRLGPVLAAYLIGFITVAMVYSPFGFLVVFGLIGGGLLAFGMLLRRRFGSHAPTTVEQRFPSEHLPTDVINMAHIRVAGVGGLGMVILAAVIALALPRVGMSVAAGLVGGAIAALAVILYRRRHGPITSSDHGLPGARTVLVPGSEDPGLHREGPGLHEHHENPKAHKNLENHENPPGFSRSRPVVAKTT
jgi:hypothetical protein